MAPSGEGRKLPTIGGLEGRGLALVATKASKEKENQPIPISLVSLSYAKQLLRRRNQSAPNELGAG
jgi:hypothetical protein